MRRSLILNSTLALVTAGVGFAGYRTMNTKKVAKVTTSVFEAKTGIVLTAVTASGNLQVPGQVDANFDSAVTSNKITEILAKVGDKVTIGQPLGRVNDATLKTALATAQASYDSTKATVEKTRAGLTADDKTQVNSSSTQARVSLDSADAALVNAKTNATINATNYSESVKQATASLSTAEATAERDLTTAQNSLDQVQAAFDKQNATYEAAKAVAAADEANRVPCDTAGGVPLDGATCKVATDKATASKATFTKEDATLTQATNNLTNSKNSLESTKLKTQQSITSATNALTNSKNSQTSGLAKDQQSIDSAARQLETQKASYAATLAANGTKLKGPTDAELAQAASQMLAAENSLATAKKNLELATLVAPSAGTIASINGKVGANPTSGSGSGAASSSTTSTAFMSVTDLSVLEVKAGFSEADAARIKVGQGVTVTLDALAGKLLAGSVRAIDTVSTLVSNVVTYYVYVTVDGSDPQVKPGMTASLSVVVDKAENVVTLPSSALTARGTAASVKVQTGATTKDVEIRNLVLGLKGDTLIEIKSGLVAGDKVIVTRGAATTTGSGTLTGGTAGAGAGAGAGFGGAVPGAGAGGAASGGAVRGPGG
jgi:multidrug efflux pump subunit AcrA (membrane-fusion protein)